MKKTHLLIMLVMGISFSAVAQDLKKLTYEGKETMIFKKVSHEEYVLTKKDITTLVTIDKITSKGYVNLFEEFKTKAVKPGTIKILAQPRRTIKYIDDNSDIHASVKGDVSRNIWGDVTGLEITAKKMNNIHDRTVIREANKYLNQSSLGGILEHDIERSNLTCKKKSAAEIICEQEYYYSIFETGRTLGRIGSR